jgi:hypothetical protein
VLYVHPLHSEVVEAEKFLLRQRVSIEQLANTVLVRKEEDAAGVQEDGGDSVSVHGASVDHL